MALTLHARCANHSSFDPKMPSGDAATCFDNCSAKKLPTTSPTPLTAAPLRAVRREILFFGSCIALSLHVSVGIGRCRECMYGQVRRSWRVFIRRILADESRGQPGLEGSEVRLGETEGAGRGAGNRRGNESRTRDVSNLDIGVCCAGPSFSLESPQQPSNP